MIIKGNRIIADEGKILFNGEAVSKDVTLGVNDSVDNWQEIDETSPEELLVKADQSIDFSQKEITKLKQQITTMSEQLDFYESCIAEMAEVVYE